MRRRRSGSGHIQWRHSQVHLLLSGPTASSQACRGLQQNLQQSSSTAELLVLTLRSVPVITLKVNSYCLFSGTSDAFYLVHYGTLVLYLLLIWERLHASKMFIPSDHKGFRQRGTAEIHSFRYQARYCIITLLHFVGEKDSMCRDWTVTVCQDLCIFDFNTGAKKI